jgi:alkylation response protein AidB-like acyl-CoA dehydrogenase
MQTSVPDASVDLPGLEPTSDDLAFRDEFRSWLREHLTAAFRTAAGRGGPGDDDAWELRLAWERELAAGRWIGLSWPREYGGREATRTQEVLFHLEYAAAGAPARCTHFGEALLAPTLLARGSEELKRRFLPPIARGEELWCQGYSEPGAGSDLAAVQTRARLDGDDWVVDGQKVWTTFARHADWIFALCRTQPGSSGRAGLSYLLIPLDQPGVDVRPIRSLAGAADFNEVFFDGARTPRANVVGEPGDGWRVAMSTLGHERATSVLAYQFSFVAEFGRLVDAVRSRGLAGDVSVRRRLAECWTGLEVMRLNNARMLTGLLRDGTLGPEASFTKFYWSRWHQDFCDLAMDLLGADATVLEGESGEGYRPTGLVRSWLTSRSETIYAGTTEIQLNIIGERVLGLPKDGAARREASWSST